jgi:hypothetical protein
MRMAASTAPGRKEVFPEAISRIVLRIQKPVVGSYRDADRAEELADAVAVGRAVERLLAARAHDEVLALEEGVYDCEDVQRPSGAP